MTYVRNTHTGEKLLCCWDDCERPGQDEIRVMEKQGQHNAIYIFCNTVHRNMHINGHNSYGRLAVGDRK